VSAKDASSHQQQAKNLSDSVASFLEAFCAWKCTHGVGWHLLRPVLRLLLWLIPEHVFSPEPTAQAPAIEQADPAPPQGSGRRSQASDAHVDCRWREAFGVSFTLDVASVSQWCPAVNTYYRSYTVTALCCGSDLHSQGLIFDTPHCTLLASCFMLMSHAARTLGCVLQRYESQGSRHALE
jgi:hypothetical protein